MYDEEINLPTYQRVNRMSQLLWPVKSSVNRSFLLLSFETPGQTDCKLHIFLERMESIGPSPFPVVQGAGIMMSTIKPETKGTNNYMEVAAEFHLFLHL